MIDLGDKCEISDCAEKQKFVLGGKKERLMSEIYINVAKLKDWFVADRAANASISNMTSSVILSVLHRENFHHFQVLIPITKSSTSSHPAV